jgi:hypothetical protein
MHYGCLLAEQEPQHESVVTLFIMVQGPFSAQRLYQLSALSRQLSAFSLAKGSA